MISNITTQLFRYKAILNEILKRVYTFILVLSYLFFEMISHTILILCE